MRKVFLDDLPRKLGTGVNKNKLCIDWQNSIGKHVFFIYQDISGKLEIVDYIAKGQKLKIQYNNDYLSLHAGSFVNCNIGTLIGKVRREYIYDINEIIETKTGKIQILEQILIKNKNSNYRGYVYRCLIDGYVGKIMQVNLDLLQGCPVCANNKVLKNYNDLWTTHPKIASLLKYPEIGYEISYGSNKYQIFICPNCGFEKSLKTNTLVSQGFGCPKCGDGLSYPNKFIHNFLDQLNEEYIFEYLPDWSNGKVYDNCLINKKEIWEVHGIQHYKHSFKKIGKRARTLKEEQINDKLKKKLAKENGYKYIEIDARKSELEWIKNSILNLPEIKRYDLSKINWLQCHEFALSSLVKIVCDYWKNGIKNTKDIAKIIKLHHTTIIRYLKRGVILGWCDYDPKEALKNSVANNGRKNNKHIVQLSKNGEFIRKWDSMISASKELNIRSTSISEVCRGKYKSASNYKWMYEEDYEQYIKDKMN